MRPPEEEEEEEGGSKMKKKRKRGGGAPAPSVSEVPSAEPDEGEPQEPRPGGEKLAVV